MALYRIPITRIVLRWRSFSQSRATGDECGVELPFKKGKGTEGHPDREKDPLPEWPGGVNPHTGEQGGPHGPEPTRYGDWERKGRVSDF